MAEVVLLGVADEVMKENDDSVCGWSTNKIGGRPNWINGTPAGETLRCTVCANHLSHVAQVYCPLQASQYHRVLYIFACINRRCWNQSASWKVLRSQAIDSSCSMQQQNISENFMQCCDEWCDDSEDWGDNDSAVAEIESFVGKMTVKECNSACNLMKDENVTKKLSSNDICQHSMSNELTDSSSTFIPYYVSVFEQRCHQIQTSEMSFHEKELLLEYERREGSKVTDMARKLTGTADTFHSENYEKTSLKHGDQAFYKFRKELQYCPQQCLRYLWNGKPLTIGKKDASELKLDVPNCPHCGGERVYELQLMPALVHLLKGANTTIREPSSISQENIPFTKVNEHSALEKLGLKRESDNSDHIEDKLNTELFRQPLYATDLNAFVSSGCFTGSLLQETCHSYQSVKNSRESDILDLRVNECDISNDVTTVVAEECSRVGNREVSDILTSDNKVAVEFGTVIVFTCATSCWTESSSNSFYREEFVIVEPDPDLSLFR